MSGEVPLDVVGVKEIARRLNVRPQTAAAWKHRKLLPDPEGYVSGAPCWRWSRIETWAADTGRIGPRMPGRVRQMEILIQALQKDNQRLREEMEDAIDCLCGYGFGDMDPVPAMRAALEAQP